MNPSLDFCAHCHTPLATTAGGVLCPACSLERALLPEEELPVDEVFPRRFGGYELLGEVGRGGMGLVFRARQLSLDRTVALKVMLYGSFGDRVSRQRFRAEAELAARLQHPNIVAIHEVGEHDGAPYLTMDLVDGPDLGRRCAGHPLPSEIAARYLRDIARAVQAAHNAGVLHRDLKPSNILVGSDGRVRVSDFGLAKRQDSARSGGLTATGQVLGSPSYTSPEQAAGRAENAGPAGDVYGLGAVLYHLITGRAPFVAATAAETLRLVLDSEPVPPRVLNPALPRDLETICLKCLQKDPACRYGSAAAVAEEIDRFLDGRPIRARPMSLGGRVWRWCRRHPAVAGMAACLFLVLTAATVIANLQARRTDRARQAAVSSRGEAERLVTSVLDEVEKNIESSGRSDQVANLARQAVDYYDNLPADQRSWETERRRARALTHLGKALKLQGKAREAGVETGRAIGILDALRRDGDLSDATAIALVEALISDTESKAEVQDHTAAVAEAKRAVACIEPLAGRPGTSFAARRAHVLALGNLAVRLGNSGDRSEGLAILERTVPILRELCAQPEADDNLRIEAARMTANLTLALGWLTDDRKRIRDLLEEGTRLIQGVVDQQPGHIRALNMLGFMQGSLQDYYWGELEMQEALRCLELKAAAADRGRLIDPTYADFRARQMLARYDRQLWRVEQGQEVAAVLAGWRAELDAKAGQTEPMGSTWMDVWIWRNPAWWFAQAGDRIHADHAVARGKAVAAGIRANSSADSIDLRGSQMEIPIAQATTALLFGDLSTARSEARAALALIEGLPGSQRQVFRAQERSIRSTLAWVHLGTGDFAAAVKDTSGDDPPRTNRMDQRGEFAELKTPRALALARLGRLAESRTTIEPVVAFFRDVCATNPGYHAFEEELARALFVEAVAQPPEAVERRRALLGEAAALIAAMNEDYRALRTVQELSGWIAAEQAADGKANR